jgi:hypothetical protein
MTQYIDKDILVAEIERRIKTNKECMLGLRNLDYYQGKVDALNETISFLNTLEVKGVEEKFERPNIEAKDSVEVSSRMPHMDKKLLPIAEFIMDYASWNLHKDEWNQPVLEVPLFRVLDALVQKGKPYCEG